MRRLLVLAAASACVLVSSSARADGDDSFSELFRVEGPGYGITSAGVGLAGRSQAADNSVSVTTGTLKLEGIPTGATIKSAHLYWAIHGGIIDTQIKINDTSVTGNVIGTVGHTCWPNQPMYMLENQPNRVYRADVTANVTGNGDYVLTEFPTGPGDTDMQGASLVVVYEDPADPAIGTVIVHDGARLRDAKSAIDIEGTFTGLKPGKLLSAQLRFGAGDGQAVHEDGDLEWEDKKLPRPPAHYWGNSDGRYWDDHVYDMTTRLDLTKSTGTYKVERGVDCIVLAYTALSYRVEGPSGGDAGGGGGPGGGGEPGGGGGAGGGAGGPNGGTSGDGGAENGEGVGGGLAGEPASHESGCGCSVVGVPSAVGGAGALAAIALALTARRRRGTR